MYIIYTWIEFSKTAIHEKNKWNENQLSLYKCEKILFLKPWTHKYFTLKRITYTISISPSQSLLLYIVSYNSNDYKKKKFPPFNCYRGGRDRRGDLRETVQTGSITNVPEPGRPTAFSINGEHSVQRESSWNQTTWSTSLESSSKKDRSIGSEAGETGAPQDLSEENQGRTMHIVVTQERVEKFLRRRAGHREEESAQQHGTPKADRAAKRVRGSAYPRASCREEGEGAESRDLEASGCLLWYVERDEPDLDGPGGGSEAATREASNEAQCSKEESRHDALRERLGRIVSDSAHEHAKHTSTCSKRTSRICCYSLGKKERMDERQSSTRRFETIETIFFKHACMRTRKTAWPV